MNFSKNAYPDVIKLIFVNKSANVPRHPMYLFHVLITCNVASVNNMQENGVGNITVLALQAQYVSCYLAG